MLETQKAHCLVLPIRDAPSHDNYGISPNKLFDYLLAGRPIHFLGNDPDYLVVEAADGLSAPWTNLHSVVESMAWLVSATDAELDGLGLNGRKLAQSEFAFSFLAKKLSDELVRLVK
jgi:hypothetical protein